MLKITNVNVKLGETDYAAVISNELNIPKRNIKDIKILRKSIDARRTKVHFIMSFAFSSNNEEKLLKRHKKLSIYKPYVYNYLPQTQDHVVVVGSGPAGLFCAYVLAHAGNQVTVIERGSKIEKRVDDVDRLMRDGILNEKDNIAFGEGGAGTFSDGKLTTGTKNPRIRYVLDTFLAHGAPAEIGYDALPHIGTDRLRAVIINMRKELERLGTNFMFDTKFVDFYDQAACPKRGISLDKMSGSLTFEELNMLLDWMAMYKLNGLQWNGNGALTEAENEALRNRATALGIEVFASAAGIPTQDCIEAEGNAQFPASSRIFLHSAVGKGGVLYLKGLGEKDKEAVMAFAERYWRGGDAGEGTVEDALPEALSTAGTRLANFNERVDVHKTRFCDKK